MQIISSIDIVQKYLPVIYFHNDEKYFPVSIDWLLPKSELIIDRQIVAPIGQVTSRLLYEKSIPYNFQKTRQIVWNIPKDLVIGQNPIDVPIYYFVKEDDQYIYIYYLVISCYNGNYPILGVAYKGSHMGDLEHLTLVIDKNDNRLIKVYFGAHGDANGRWVDEKELTWENGRFVVYTALNGHGFYHKNGVAIRIGGLANDRMEKGIQWKPNPAMVRVTGNQTVPTGTSDVFHSMDPEDVDKFGWVAFSGVFGDDDGIGWLGAKNWFKNGDPPHELLDSPILISHEIYNIYDTFFYLLLFIAGYIIMMIGFKYSNDYLSDNNKSNILHITVIISVIILFYIGRASLARIVDWVA